jgi:outer membrane murein-binding lipoprotein Lpp
MRRTATTLLAVMLGLSLLAGCGSDKKSGPSKEKYAEQYKPINDQFLALGKEVANTVRTAKGQTDVALADKFAQQARQVGDLKGRLDDLDPPDDYRPDHDKLLVAMGLVEGDLQEISDTARAHDAAGAKAATQKLFTDSAQVRTPRRALAAKTGAKSE